MLRSQNNTHRNRPLHTCLFYQDCTGIETRPMIVISNMVFFFNAIEIQHLWMPLIHQLYTRIEPHIATESSPYIDIIICHTLNGIPLHYYICIFFKIHLYIIDIAVSTQIISSTFRSIWAFYSRPYSPSKSTSSFLKASNKFKRNRPLLFHIFMDRYNSTKNNTYTNYQNNLFHNQRTSSFLVPRPLGRRNYNGYSILLTPSIIPSGNQPPIKYPVGFSII